MRRPTKLSDYPWVVMRLDCVLCDRKGCYRLARLAARYGPEQSLDGLLADLANDCPWWRSNPRKYEPRCEARFVDLGRNLPPPDSPQASVYRQREPDRENVPNRRSIQTSGEAPVPMLSTWPSATIVITCDRCGRREVFEKAKLLRATIGDAKLTDLRVGLTCDCPRRRAQSIYEQCGAKFETPDQTSSRPD